MTTNRAMPRRRLGDSGLEVGAIGLGCIGMTWAYDTRERDLRARNPRFTRAALQANRAIVDRVRAVAERHGATAAQVALAWVLAQDELIVPIPGTTKVERVEENAAAALLALDADDLAVLDAAPPEVGARY